MPFCIKCKKDKREDEFGRARPKQKKNGLKTYCKECCTADSKAYYERNKQKVAEHKKGYQKENKEELNAVSRAYYRDNKDELLIKVREYQKKHSKRLSKGAKARGIKYREVHKERLTADNKEYCRINSEKISARAKKYRSANAEKIAANARVYRKANPERGRAHKSARRARELRSVPKWETDVHLKEIVWRRENRGMSLDHIVPIAPPLAISLGGRPVGPMFRRRFMGPLIPLVYGFHTPANWQPLPLRENISKGNRDWPDSPWS